MPDKLTALVIEGTAPWSRALVESFARRGFRVYFTWAENPQNATELAARVRSNNGEVWAVKANPANSHDLIQTAHDIGSTEGGIDCAVHCLVRSNPEMTSFDVEEGEWLHATSTILMGFYFLCKSVLPFMVGREHPQLVLPLPAQLDEMEGMHIIACRAAGVEMVENISRQVSKMGVLARTLMIPQTFATSEAERARHWSTLGEDTAQLLAGFHLGG